MTTTTMSLKRAWWRDERARPSQLPPEKYDVWTIWADRGWGKTRAALEEMLRLGETTTTHSSMGPRPPRIGVFTESRNDVDLIMEMLRQIVEGDFSVSGARQHLTVEFQHYAQLHFFHYSNIDSARGLPLDHFLLEDIEKSTFEQRDAVYRLYHQAARWHQDARMVQTCYVMPTMPLGRVVGNRRHLTVGPDAAENTALTSEQMHAIAETKR